MNPEDKIELRKIGLENVWKTVKLKVNPEQETFVASNVESIIEAYATQADGYIAIPLTIYCGDTPVGFVMLGYGDTGEDEVPDYAMNNYCLWRFMIDKNFQRQGLGRKALNAVLDYVRTDPCGHADCLWTSYEPSNSVARALYLSFGFEENGDQVDGEDVAILKL